MKTFLTSALAIILISAGAWLVLNAIGFSSAEVYSSPNVSLPPVKENY